MTHGTDIQTAERHDELKHKPDRQERRENIN